ncbi:MAG: hypothetical protein HYR94_26750 [Chloroflexi bacterium]|nr:hypothetical protein [Chloroflexota bacterium]
MTLLRNKLFMAVTVGHLVIDIFNSMGSVLVTFLSIPMALGTAQIGLALSSYSLLAAITQPLFGWLADKAGRFIPWRRCTRPQQWSARRRWEPACSFYLDREDWPAGQSWVV